MTREKLDWFNGNANNQPEYAQEAYTMFVEEYTIYKQAWIDHAPAGKRPVFSVRSDSNGGVNVSVALANGTAKKESLADWLERNKFK